MLISNIDGALPICVSKASRDGINPLGLRVSTSLAGLWLSKANTNKSWYWRQKKFLGRTYHPYTGNNFLSLSIFGKYNSCRRFCGLFFFFFFSSPTPLSLRGAHEEFDWPVLCQWARFGGSGVFMSKKLAPWEQIKHDSRCPPLWVNGQFSERVAMNKEILKWSEPTLPFELVVLLLGHLGKDAFR